MKCGEEVDRCDNIIIWQLMFCGFVVGERWESAPWQSANYTLTVTGKVMFIAWQLKVWNQVGTTAAC